MIISLRLLVSLAASVCVQLSITESVVVHQSVDDFTSLQYLNSYPRASQAYLTPIPRAPTAFAASPIPVVDASMT